MFVTLIARSPCLLCGYQHKILRFSDVRVNKCSLKERGVSLAALGEIFCPECHTRNAGGLLPVSRYALHPEDAARVAAYRARKWPPAVGAVA